MFRTIAGTSVQSFRELILCDMSPELETLKVTIIKALIQVNRNHNVPDKVIAQECAYFLRIEAIANPSRETGILDLVAKLGRIA